MARNPDQDVGPDPLVEKIWGEIRALDLESHIAELEVKGYTLIGPEIACPNGLAGRLLEASLDVAERRNGVRPNLLAQARQAPDHAEMFEGALGAEEGDSPIGDLMQFVVLEGRVFEEALMNPVVLAMASYLCGYSSTLLTMACVVKGPNRTPLPLHADSLGTSPLQALATECNMTYALTDYSRENGATVFVPGSHKWCRQPLGEERNVLDNPRAVPVDCPAGSLICWHGNTWHGALNRTAPGVRVSVIVDFVRKHIRPQENLHGKVPRKVLDRNPPRFAVLTHQGFPQVGQDPNRSKADIEQSQQYLRAYYQDFGVDLQQASGAYA